MTIVQPKLPRVTFFANTPGEPYRPCNGSEGEYFHAMWCEECERDKSMNGTVYREGREETDDDWCEILGRSFRSDEPLPEWVYGKNGQPCCTAFAPLGDKPPTPRCEHTADMFGEPRQSNLDAPNQDVTAREERIKPDPSTGAQP